MDRDMPPIRGGLGGEKSQIDRILAPGQKPPKPCSTPDDLNAIPNTCLPITSSAQVFAHSRNIEEKLKIYERNIKKI